MAIKNAKATAGGRKTPAAPQPMGATVARVPATSRTSSPQQLMREAAWSRMFGRTETKNPFTR
jgi:hypothetical protein